MSTAPRFAFVDLTTGWRTVRGRAGHAPAGHGLRNAAAIAALRAHGVPARAVVQRRALTVAHLVADVLRPGADVVVLWAPTPAPPVVGGLADALRAAAPELVVAVADGELEARCLALAGDWPRARALPEAGLPAMEALHSPWLDGVLPATAAARVGVELDRGPGRRQPATRVAAELAWLAGHVLETTEVALHGTLAAEDPAAVAALLAPLARGRLLRPAVVAGAVTAAPHAGLLAALAAAGATQVGVTVGGADDPAAARAGVRGWQDAASAHGLDVVPEADLVADPDRVDELEALLAAVGAEAPATTVTWRPVAPGAPPRRPARLAVPELAPSAGAAEAAALERSVLARLLRAHEGLYATGAGFADAAAELVWCHPDPPVRHAAWLAGVLGASSLLVAERPASAWVAAPAPLAEAWALRDEGEGRWRLETGDAVERRPYREGRDHTPVTPLVLTFDERADAEALRDDADRAAHGGGLPPALTSGLTHLQDAVLWTAPHADPSRRLPRLWVDADGAVRPGPVAAPLGTLGDPFGALLERTDAQPTCCPPWLDAAELSAWHEQHPALLALAAAPLLRRRLAEVLDPQAAAAPLQIAGLGGPPAYDGPGAGPPRGRWVLAAAGDARVLLDPATGRVTRVTPDIAALWEGLAATRSAETVAAWLAETRGVAAEKATAAVRQVAARLGGGLLPARPPQPAGVPA